MTTSVEDETSVIGTRRAALDIRSTSARSRRSLRQRVRLPLMLAGPLVVLLVGGYWYLTGGRYVSTDDAYVHTARMTISTDISGRVVEIAVRDNERVKADQVLFRLDPRPYRIAVEQAKAQLAAERLQIDAMKATYHQKRADARATEATVAYQQREFERQKQLMASGTTSRQQFEQASQAYDTGRQQLTAKQQDIANTLASLGGDPDIPVDQHPLSGLHLSERLERIVRSKERDGDRRRLFEAQVAWFGRNEPRVDRHVRRQAARPAQTPGAARPPAPHGECLVG